MAKRNFVADRLHLDDRIFLHNAETDNNVCVCVCVHTEMDNNAILSEISESEDGSKNQEEITTVTIRHNSIRFKNIAKFCLDCYRHGAFWKSSSGRQK